MHSLIIIDMLNDFLDRWEEQERDELIQNTNELIKHFRSADLPIIWVKQEFNADLSDAFLEMRDNNISITIKGTRGAEIPESLNLNSSDVVIVKKRYSAFFGTTLESILNEKYVSKITLAGVNTHACIRMAAIDAYQRDLRVIIANDCVDTQDREHGSVSLTYMDGKIAAVESNAQIISGIRKKVF